jgi:thiol-disulfide isomerase/thioredoxin
MKLILILLVFPSLLWAQKSTKGEFLLTGKIKKLSSGYIYFAIYDNNNKRHLDSLMLENGNFSYKGKLTGYLDNFYIKLNPNNLNNNDSINNVKVPIENVTMHINLELGKFSKYELIGCESCKIVNTFDSLDKVRYDTSLVHDSIFDNPNVDVNLKRVLEATDSIKRVNYYKKWISICEANFNKNFATYILYRILYANNLKKIKLIAAKQNDAQKNSYYGSKLKKDILELENELIEEKISKIKLLNTISYKFKTNGIDGKSIDLKESYESGYTLLDFWASWCVPCRKSHPKFISLFNKYSKSNFKVIGISIDENMEDWKKAIAKDSISIWPNVIDTENENGLNLAKKYNINYYPTKILIDRNGIIIGIYIGEDFTKLEKKLKEIYNY